MPMQKQSYQIVGMKQDNLVGTGFSTKFAHEIKNMRLNTVGDYTTGVWTTERGTKELPISLYTSEKYKDKEIDILQHSIINNFPLSSHESPDTPFHDSCLVDLSSLIVIGQAVLNNQWILFGKINGQTENSIFDCILRIFYIDDSLYCEVLYFGNLNFNTDNPIETLVYYENEEIQKVYWTDGLNQPRVINIVNVKQRFNFDTQFDFAREVSLNETITIKKLQSGTGLFPPCTVKYVLTYYDKYGQESNIIYDSPLYYPTKGDRGCSADELSGDSFEITVSGLDTNFDYIRLYSIVRTSEDATPIVRIVADKLVSDAVDDTIVFTDTNTIGEIIDPDILRFIGSRNITAQTFDQKTNTLFLGNIELSTKSITDILSGVNWNTISWKLTHWVPVGGGHFILIPIKQRYYNIDGTYPYTNQMVKTYKKVGTDYLEDTEHVSSQDLKHFKKGEKYTFGLQFQDKYGVWSEVLSPDTWTIENDKDAELYTTDNEYANIQFSCPTVSLPSSVINKVVAEGYKKVRLVCAEKNNTNRQIIAQGVVDSTMYEQSTLTSNNNPYRYISWFFRPKENLYSSEGDFRGTRSYGTLRPVSKYTFGYSGYDNISAIAYDANKNSADNWLDNFSVEVQNDGGRDYTEGSPGYFKDIPKWKVTRDWLTFHSPELDFDESLNTLDFSNISCKITGYIPIDAKASEWYVSTAESSLSNYNYTDVRTFKCNDSHVDNGGSSSSEVNAWKYRTHLQQNPMPHWHSDTTDNSYRCDLFPFQQKDLSNIAYDYKIYSTILISKIPIINNTKYQTSYWDNVANEYNVNLNDFFDKNIKKETDDFKIVTKDSESYVTLPNLSDNNNPATLCAKDVKKIAPFINPYPLFDIDNNQPDNHKVNLISKPITITYKTNTLGLFKTTFDELSSEDNNIIWKHLSDTKYENRPYLWLTEISRPVTNIDDVKNLVFVPCGPAITLPSSTNSSLEVYGLEGDWYFMRYDCLKTFPYTTSDKNQIVEILSFMCESRVNLDGRYDNKRGLLDNTSVLDTNFNLINKSYTQTNDFFKYTVLDTLSATLNQFSNQITYTPVKVAGEDIDAWTNITLANVDNADGSCGKINKIINVNDKLFLLQDYGIARINYDEKTTLTTDSGVPIELNSSGKYTGIDYINKSIGCQNKWSISNTKNGLFWIDDSRRELLTLDENMTSVTTLNGFDSFMINHCNTKQSWTPDFHNFITYYDKLSKDVYFINNTTCLAWNEISKTFTSFYDYDNVSALATIDDHTLMFRNTNNNGAVYAARENNNYSYFFNSYKPYWITLVCDGSSAQNNNFSLDKVFDTIEYRADIFNENANISDNHHNNYNNPIFDIKHVWNGYQDSDECTLEGIRKFNTWRVQLPRHKGNRDRIRNPFCYIKLYQSNTNPTQQDRMILHDLAVSYSIK